VTGLWLFVPHFMLFLLPAMFVVFGAGLVYLRGSGRWTGSNIPSLAVRYLPLALAAVWLVAQVWGLSLFYRYPPHGADGLRELAAMLNRESQPGDLVLVTPHVLQANLAQYYGGETRGLPADFDLHRMYQPYDPARWHADSVREFNSLTESRRHFWLVYRPELDEGGNFLAEAGRRYREAEQHRYIFATLYLFESR
jgi:hypothetical protein